MPSVRAIGMPNADSGVADAQVARERDRAPAARGDALDLRDRRLGHALEPVEHGVEPRLVCDAVLRGREVCELRDVGAGDEGLAAGAAQDEHAHARRRASTRSQASTSASYMSHVMALRASGRLKVRIASGPSVSNGVRQHFRHQSRVRSYHDPRALDGLRGARRHAGDGRARSARCSSPIWAPTSSRSSRRPATRRGRCRARVGTDSPELQRRQSRQAQHRAQPEDRRRRARSSRASRASADILIENYRPGVMAALGLDYATLSRRSTRG